MSTSDEIRLITRGGGTVVSSLLRGSVVLAGRICRCLPRVAGLGPGVWAMACRDAAATDERQRHAFDAAVAAARKAAAPEPAPGDVPRVPPVRRPVGEALGFLAAGSVVGFGVVGTVFSVTIPRLVAAIPEGIGPYVAAAVAVGWTAAALAVAPPPTPADDHENDVTGEQDTEDQDQPPAPDPGAALLTHVLGVLAVAETAGRAGVHLDAVRASAVAAGLLSEDIEQTAFRAWVESCGLPTADKVGMRIEGRPVTRVGMRIAAATEALGMTPAALLRARSQTPAQTPVHTPGEAPADAVRAPAPAVGEGPTQTPPGVPGSGPASTPVPAPPVLSLGGVLTPDRTPSPALSQG
ncbi:hypothetical protein AB0P12_32810 [Streptomyces subrutilus]|uniref:hypothetical protein n=1 Tax=Streptomyces subrutilus TaxID=36818 RepID=UPI003448337E